MAKENWEEIGKRLKMIRKNKGITIEKLAQMVGVSHSTISRIESGQEPRAINLAKIAEALEVSLDYLMGLRTLEDVKDAEKVTIEDMQFNLKKIPILGEISAGNGIDPIENIIDVIYIPEKRNVDFALMVRGDSMLPKFKPGDLALVVKTPVLENGEIGIIAINSDQAVIKKYYNYGDKIQLVSLNPEYEPIIISGEEMDDIHIFGKVVGKISWE
ncbi:LexA family transcriptional regulator [Marinitoga sp. 1137]|uniref:LexA family protein n=1 Tax=Marinitoga sp. 1137 TaxID=1545835 RepID=UPI0009524D9E|nr:XRE family transcriptional regulator [Marinitoga sp. 1137]